MSEPTSLPDAAAAGASSDDIGVVRSFLAALEELDIDRALEFTDDEIVYQNVPLPPARGRAAFERQMRTMARFGTGFEARIHHIASDGGVVLTERTDVLEAGRLRAAFWVCGTFELRDGRIVAWRDYFDWPTVIFAFLKGAVAALIGALTGRSR